MVIGDAITDYADDYNYTADTGKLSTIKNAITTYIVDPNADYEMEKDYTLTELLELDTQGIIEQVLVDQVELVEYEGVAPYDLNCDSEVFEGVTTDDVLIRISISGVSVYVPANEKYRDKFESYKTGSAYTAKP